mmetsp:Transcript_34881/g.53494  ORF Transcript_34881/g.53494 Transcript_34881/m.53494 type:complete len:175 (-) Transcript_34881:170-694(-)|eukprot:CAMPEP_0118673382 /NCGR_PEP_ID=MMETSP0800-20121206/289_1 /TAXON_ID=210618 ORGANISM="Striatella unipunctata, Strain CCMP2910" /NCGR_SAMPLE_ID=MMETSP0800 /ASSEMBLY_ACC=CAM_ASM_000638 /LENGTH=174 /DNA_ID=CAMNT_0006568435 /DNA_START=219 /DNA_END=743 /DNA_ORIENTATION=-
MNAKAPVGGESTFADGFAAAELLRSKDKEAFETLAQTTRRYRCVDKPNGWNLEASGPVISCYNGFGPVVAIRHNDLDRLPDLPPFPTSNDSEIEEFYNKLECAHEQWDKILKNPEFGSVISLQPGETVVVANQRSLHGRLGFQLARNSPRSVIGCYVSQDDLNSRFRQEGFQVL